MIAYLLGTALSGSLVGILAARLSWPRVLGCAAVISLANALIYMGAHP